MNPTTIFLTLLIIFAPALFFQIALRGKGMEKFAGNLLKIFLIGWLQYEEEWFWRFKPFSKLKTTACKYWALVKIEISMNCVYYKEHKIKMKMVQEQWLQLKNEVFIGL